MYASGVLQYAWGTGPSVLYGAENNGVIVKALKGSLPALAAYSAFNVNYSDSGLLGIVLLAPSKSAGSLVDAAVKVIKQGSVSGADFNRGIKFEGF